MATPKKKVRLRGKRVNIWVPEHHLGLWGRLENKSKFVQIALDDAIGIMAWALLKEKDKTYANKPPKYKLEDVIEPFNETFPLDPVTKLRLEKRERQKCENSAPKQELW